VLQNQSAKSILKYKVELYIRNPFLKYKTMSVLNSIRKRSTLLLVAVGGALVLFVVGDLLTSNQSFNDDYKYIGEVDGEKISAEFFELENKKSEENYLLNTQQSNIDENTADMIRNQTWNQIVTDIIMKSQLEKTGITVTPEELYDLVTGPNPHPSIKQAFTNPNTQVFDPASVVNFLKTMDQDQTGQTKQRWLSFEKSLKAEQEQNKYYNAIKKGIYFPTAIAKQDYNEKNTTANIQYIVKRYASIADTAVKVDDSDLQRYYKANINDFKQEDETRKLEYVVFDVNATAEDIAEAKKQFEVIKQDFQNANNDSAFVNANSDSKYFSGYVGKGSLPAILDSTLFNAEKGTTFGVYEEFGFLKVAKLMGIKNLPDSVKARHILIKTEGGNNAAAKLKADSLLKLIKAGAKFDELAKSNSEDFGSAQKGGDLGWFKPGMMVPTFNDACFEGKKGDFPIVESQFGVHLIEITDQGKPSRKVLVGIVDQKIEPSKKTYDAIYAQASKFSSEARTKEQFEKLSIDNGYIRRPADNLKEKDRNIPGLESSREIIKWAYKATPGTISAPFEAGNKFAVACLYSIKEKGFASLESVKDRVEAGAIKDKKAEMFVEEMKKAAEGAKTIVDAASKLSLTPEFASSITFTSATIMNVGREPKVTGRIFNCEKGKLIGPIKGDLGVFMIVLNEVVQAPETKDYLANKTQLASSIESRVSFEVFNALKEKAKVADKLGKFY
jgi:peptidyl-prolyl cis-trans isomerase D